LTRPGALSEEDVVRGAQAGDERMYRELVGRYLRPALAVAWEFTETIEDAEDVVQEAFRRAVDALGRFDAGRPFAPGSSRSCATSRVTPAAGVRSSSTPRSRRTFAASCRRPRS